MKTIILIGQTNIGKTLFLINFAAYLGMKNIQISFQSRKQGSYHKQLSLSEAKSLLVSNRHHQTKDLQSTVLTLPWGKGERKFELIDTAGLIDGIHHEEEIRQAMAQTLACIRKADIILHMIDTTRVSQKDVLEGIGEIDFQVAQFGQLKSKYIILANKNDLPEAKGGLEKITSEFPGNRIIKLSAMDQTGFKEVKEFVKQHI